MPRQRAIAVLVALGLMSSVLLVGGCAHTAALSAPVPTNVVLMIGDGMGLAQVTAAEVHAGGLEMDRLAVGGFVTTFAADSLVTDSAASGTAYATGRKTRNGAVSVSPEGEPMRTVLEHAEDRGMATGLVVTCSVTHATPAAFVAHVNERDAEFEIAEQIASSGVDVLFGGGAKFFLPRAGGGARSDGVDLADSLRRRMPVALSAEEFRALNTPDRAAALLAAEDLPTAPTRDPGLPELTEKALDILSRDEDGFFVMIEGSQIDWAAHDNEHDRLVEEILDFDRAVGIVMDFAERNGRTLVVVTADHETGAYAVLGGSRERRDVSTPRFASGGHTASMVPLLAYGPGSGAFGGIEDNAEVGRRLIAYVTAPR